MHDAKTRPSALRAGSSKSPVWQVAAVTDVKKAQSIYRKLKEAGTTDRRVIVLGPSAFAVVWR